MTDNHYGLFDGAAGAEAIVITATANEAIKIGSIVSWAAAGTGERFPRVEHPSGNTVPMCGVVVGGSANGTWVDGTTANDGNAAAAAGDTVKVCVFGRCKIRVEGTTDVAINDPLTYATDGVADTATTSHFVIARAMEAGTDPNTAILCFVNVEGVL
jgi:hypothetical protein